MLAIEDIPVHSEARGAHVGPGRSGGGQVTCLTGSGLPLVGLEVHGIPGSRVTLKDILDIYLGICYWL